MGSQGVQARFEEIAASIRQDITDGLLAPGQKLDSEAVLAERFATSKPTVGQALRKLKAEGVVFPVHGRGWFVTGSPNSFTNASGIRDHLREQMLSGKLGRGVSLPGEVALAREYGVARGTVRRAYIELEENGLIETRPGQTRVVIFDRAR
jgi:DNA-binding GntR family transcriptional regulator